MPEENEVLSCLKYVIGGIFCMSANVKHTIVLYPPSSENTKIL